MQVLAALRMTLYQVGQLQDVPASGRASPWSTAGAERMWLQEEHAEDLCAVLAEVQSTVHANKRFLEQVRAPLHEPETCLWAGAAPGASCGWSLHRLLAPKRVRTQVENECSQVVSDQIPSL